MRGNLVDGTGVAQDPRRPRLRRPVLDAPFVGHDVVPGRQGDGVAARKIRVRVRRRRGRPDGPFGACGGGGRNGRGHVPFAVCHSRPATGLPGAVTSSRAGEPDTMLCRRQAMTIDTARIRRFAPAVAAAIVALAGASARAADWPQFRGPNGAGACAGRDRPPRMERDRQRHLEDAGPRSRVVVAGGGGRTPLAHHGADRPRRGQLAAAARLRRRDREPRPRCGGLRQQRGVSAQSEEQPRVADAGARPGRRAGLRPLRRRRDGRRQHRRRDPVAHPLSLHLAARQRRVAHPPRRQAHRQHRRLRHRLPRGRRRADRRGALALGPPRSGVAGLLHADRRSGRRPRADRQRQRVPDVGARSGVGAGDLAGRLSTGLLQRPAAGLRPRARLSVDRLPAADLDGGARRRRR